MSQFSQGAVPDSEVGRTASQLSSGLAHDMQNFWTLRKQFDTTHEGRQAMLERSCQ